LTTDPHRRAEWVLFVGADQTGGQGFAGKKLVNDNAKVKAIDQADDQSLDKSSVPKYERKIVHPPNQKQGERGIYKKPSHADELASRDSINNKKKKKESLQGRNPLLLWTTARSRSRAGGGTLFGTDEGIKMKDPTLGKAAPPASMVP